MKISLAKKILSKLNNTSNNDVNEFLDTSYNPIFKYDGWRPVNYNGIPSKDIDATDAVPDYFSPAYDLMNKYQL